MRKLVYNAAMPLPTALVASVVSAVLEMTGQSVAPDAQSQRDFDQFIASRRLPPQVKLGIMIPPVANGQVTINDQPQPISPATQFRNRQNLIVMPMTIREKQDIVYLNDFQGNVHRVWMIGPDELEAIKAAQKNSIIAKEATGAHIMQRCDSSITERT